MASSLPLLLLLLGTLTVAQAQLRVFSLRASNLPSDAMSPADGYLKVFCGSATLGRTAVRNNDPNPWWTEEFAHFQAKENDKLKIEVHDSDVIFDDLVGVCETLIQPGTHTRDCHLKKDGVLHYSYTLGGGK